MSDQFVGEIRLFPYANRVPEGWLACEGQTLAIANYQALYALLRVQYGGDGKTTFCLPDLRGRTPVGYGMARVPGRIGYPGLLALGAAGGSETVTLTASQIPAHSHAFQVDPTNAAQLPITGAVASTSIKPANAPPTAAPAPNIYAAPVAPLVAVNPAFLASIGGAAHENRQPYLALRYCIATIGTWPPRS